MKSKFNKNQGFTIVELVIVIVVIAILASIILVSYNSIQQRAKNVAIISAVKDSIELIESYTLMTGKYPLSVTSGNVSACITGNTGCYDASSSYASNSTFDSVTKDVVGALPQSVPKEGSVAYGIRYNYHTSRTYNGNPRPAVIQYFLMGSNKPCELPNSTTGSWTAGTTSTTGYYNSLTTSDGKARTQCIINIDGPAV